MRVIIAGSRTLGGEFTTKGASPEHTSAVIAAIQRVVAESGFTITTVVSGTCRGIDQMGEAWAEANGIPVERFPAQWNTLGRAAGPIRNAAMAESADALIAIRQGNSRGTANMIAEAKKRGLRVFVKEVAP